MRRVAADDSMTVKRVECGLRKCPRHIYVTDLAHIGSALAPSWIAVRRGEHLAFLCSGSHLIEFALRTTALEVRGNN